MTYEFGNLQSELTKMHEDLDEQRRTEESLKAKLA